MRRSKYNCVLCNILIEHWEICGFSSIRYSWISEDYFYPAAATILLTSFCVYVFNFYYSYAVNIKSVHNPKIYSPILLFLLNFKIFLFYNKYAIFCFSKLVVVWYVEWIKETQVEFELKICSFILQSGLHSWKNG